MKTFLLFTMWLAVLPAAAAENAAPTSTRTRFTPPFAVREGVIRDAAGREVRLWGVNYYAPFSHNFQNLAEVGADYRQAIAEDVAQFRMMGLDFVRIHVFDREISDVQGHLTPNRHLEVFDVLLEELDRAGIFVMLTPVAWWNTPENQASMDRHYAYWHVGVGSSFGFSNFYGVDEMIWNDEAIRCQERYAAELLGHRSGISGRRYADFPNLVAIEPINEPVYVRLERLTKETKDIPMHEAAQSSGPALQRLRQLWEEYRGEHPGEETQVFDQFRAELLQRYLKRMFTAIDGAMGRPYLRAYNDTLMANERMHAALNTAQVDAYTSGCYLAGDQGFDSSWNDHLNCLELARAWSEIMVPVVGAKSIASAKLARAGREAAIEQRIGDRPRIIYEFNATSTLQGYPYAALALAFAARRAQLAAMFTYTPTAVAAYNPGWRVHYLNLLHTPARAAAFAAAGEIFRRAPAGGKLPADSERWQGPGWSIQREPDAVSFFGDGLLMHCGALPELQTPAAAPATILASGSSRFVTAEGHGVYRLGQTGAGKWELMVMPNERLVNDPFRGRSFRPMANRYINVNEWPVVSRLIESPRRFTFRLDGVKNLVCTRQDGKERVPLADDGSFLLAPGTYTLIAR